MGYSQKRRRRRVAGTAITEKQFQANILKAARLTGWLAYHPYDSRRSRKGFPDLVLVKGRQIIIAELKTETGVLSDPQKEWRAALSIATDVCYRLWRPGDWDRIVETLKEAGPAPPKPPRSTPLSRGTKLWRSAPIATT